jgi:preprotein translocase subunit Sec63
MKKWREYFIIFTLMFVSLISAKPTASHRIKIKIKKINHVDITSSVDASRSVQQNVVSWNMDATAKKITVNSTTDSERVSSSENESDIIMVIDGGSGKLEIPSESSVEEKSVNVTYTVTDI